MEGSIDDSFLKIKKMSKDLTLSCDFSVFHELLIV